MSDPAFWCYGIDTAHRTVGMQEGSCRSWVGNRTANYHIRFYWDRACDHSINFLQRPFGEAVFTMCKRGDTIVAERPEYMFARPSDIDITLQMFAEKGLKLAFVTNDFGDLRFKVAQKKCCLEVMRLRRLQLEKTDLPTPSGWKNVYGSFKQDMKKRGVGSLIALLRGKYRMTYSEISRLLRACSHPGVASSLHKGYVAGWPMTDPDSLMSVKNLPETNAKKNLKRRKLRAFLMTGWHTKQEIAEHLGYAKFRANALIQKHKGHGFILTDGSGDYTKYTWVSPDKEPELWQARQATEREKTRQRIKCRDRLAARARAFREATGQTVSSPASAYACDAPQQPAEDLEVPWVT